ncbi:MAG: hypothetical protein ACRDQU_00715 [Pseudonocardiaceae bacterium]
MELMRIAGEDCLRDDCPAIFTTDNATIAVQGYIMHKETSAGETVVEIPMAVFQEAARALGR